MHLQEALTQLDHRNRQVAELRSQVAQLIRRLAEGSQGTTANPFITSMQEEVVLSVEEHGEFASLHEAWAVLFEEVDELWEWVREKAHNRDMAKIRKELVQIASVAWKTAQTMGLEEQITRRIDMSAEASKTYTSVVGHGGAQRESALTRLERICEQRRKELDKCTALLAWIQTSPDRLEGKADELLWRLLHEVDRS